MNYKSPFRSINLIKEEIKREINIKIRIILYLKELCI